MSGHTFTRHDQRWTVGYDPINASYYARVAPAYWPQPPTVAVVDEATIEEFTRRHRTTLHARHRDADPHADGRSPIRDAIDARYRDLLDSLHAAAARHTPPDPTASRDAPVYTVVGDRYGELRSLEDLEHALTGHVLLPPDIRAKLDAERRSPLTDQHLLDAHRARRGTGAGPTPPADPAVADAAEAARLARRAYPPATPPAGNSPTPSTGNPPPQGPAPGPTPRR